jgi:hypothetical protein
MKKSLAHELIENSKYSKKVDGEIGKVTYTNNNTPDNHTTGKRKKAVTKNVGLGKVAGKKKIKVAQITGPKAKERRSMTEGTVGDAISGMLMKLSGPRFGHQLYNKLKRDEPEMYQDLLDMFNNLIQQGAVTDRQQMTALMADPNATQLAMDLRDWASDKLPPQFDDWAADKLDQLDGDHVADHIDDDELEEAGILATLGKRFGTSKKAVTRIEPPISNKKTPTLVLQKKDMIGTSKIDGGSMAPNRHPRAGDRAGINEPVINVTSSKPVAKGADGVPSARGVSNSSDQIMKSAKKLNVEGVVTPATPPKPSSITRGPIVDEGVLGGVVKSASNYGKKFIDGINKPSGSAVGDASAAMNAGIAGGAGAAAVIKATGASAGNTGNHPAEVDEGAGKGISKGVDKFMSYLGNRHNIKQTLVSKDGPAYRAANGMKPATRRDGMGGMSSALNKAAAGGTAAALSGNRSDETDSLEVEEGAVKTAFDFGKGMISKANKVLRPSGSAVGDASAAMNAGIAGGAGAAAVIKATGSNKTTPVAPVDEGIVGSAVKGIAKGMKSMSTPKPRPAIGTAARDAEDLKVGGSILGTLGAAGLGGAAVAANKHANKHAKIRAHKSKNPNVESVNEFNELTELFGKKDKGDTPAHQRKNPFMSRKDKDEWEAGDDDRKKNRPRVAGPDKQDRKKKGPRVKGPDKQDRDRRAAYESAITDSGPNQSGEDGGMATPVVKKISKKGSSTDKHRSEIKTKKLPKGYTGGNPVAVAKVHESLSELSDFLDLDMNLAIGDIVENEVEEGTLDAGIKIAKGVGNLVSKFKKTKPTHSNVVDMGGKPVTKKLDTPHMDSLKGAGVQAAKDAAAVATGGAAAYGGYKALTNEEDIDEAVPLIPLAVGAARVAAPAVGRFVANAVKGAFNSAPSKAAGAAMGIQTGDDLTDMAIGKDTSDIPTTGHTPHDATRGSGHKPMNFGDVSKRKFYNPQGTPHATGGSVSNENSSGGAVGSGAIASSVGGGRKVQSQLFAGQGNITDPNSGMDTTMGAGNITQAGSGNGMDETELAPATSIRPEPRSGAMGDISRETGSAPMTSPRPMPRPSSSTNPITGGTRGVTPPSQQNEAYGTSAAFLDYSKTIDTTTDEAGLDALGVQIKRDRRLTHNEISELQSGIHRKIDNDLTEDWGSSDWSIVINQMDDTIEQLGGINPDSIEQAAADQADHYYDQMGYDNPEDAADRMVTMWMTRKGFGNLMDDAIEPTDMVNVPQDYDAYVKEFDDYAGPKYYLAWEETGGSEEEIAKAIRLGMTPLELADSWADRNGLSV